MLLSWKIEKHCIVLFYWFVFDAGIDGSIFTFYLEYGATLLSDFFLNEYVWWLKYRK